MPDAPSALWSPSQERQSSSNLGRWCREAGFSSYDEAWSWSVAPGSAGEFWQQVARRFGVAWRHPPEAALETDSSRVTGYRWFRGGRLNYAEAALRPAAVSPDAVAVVAVSQTRPTVELTWAELDQMVAGASAGLLAAGVAPGERVAGYLPNIPETLAMMLACASAGAVWACCAPEMGVTGVLDRLAQLEPAVLVAVDGYRYGERVIERHTETSDVLAALPSVRKAVWLPYLGRLAPPGWQEWADFTSARQELRFEALDFDHPLYILFSSGTTGKPKAIVHGHGGMLLEHMKALGFHFDLGPGDRFFWYTTTGWMMWNFCVSGLVTGAAVVLFDGSPTWPEKDALWDLVATTATTCAGTGSTYLVACAKDGLQPGRDHDLSRLRSLGATGSPLPAAAARWAYEAVARDFMLASFSGGTDVCTGFVGGSPLHSVFAGEISCRCLGAKVEVLDEVGDRLVGEEGELVLSAPLPSMPVGFWGDDGTRYRASYFERYPGIWAHGDRAVLTERGTVVITGRSDSTLNRGGVRMGTAELYAVVEQLPSVADSLAVHLEDPDGGPGELWLFVVEGRHGEGAAVAEEVKSAIRRELSPRYVPDKVVVVPAVPRTLSGKKLEVPVKRILMGTEPGEALSLTSVANPESLRALVDRAGQAQLRK